MQCINGNISTTRRGRQIVSDLIIGVVLGVCVGMYIGNEKARRWTNNHLFRSKKRKKQEPEKKQEDSWGKDWDK